MKRKEVEIKNKLGLHARPASLVVKMASKYQSEIQLIKEDTEINAKSILGVMMLAAGPGQKIVVTADGEDESDAVQSISELIESGFGEELA
ncbi:MAG: Phosphocarrier protein HPr [bacterium ADurb.Bin157]|jgi:phosphocarrier protein HPr|nr:HPr family phosphocarrier protein [Candidatus Riflebacteria bacterium]MDD2623722.1 HPr family phosphocarrier protein [Candidatus Riflebacteria bacterium]MDD3376246.1 HPr family phosphocarrier protein [Candidatus Riflebacteria bacterium]NCB45511.1 HPr family phosphocarrier protein [bacterium]OQB50482.1 MAG: Phosphocarrier protein HPr [bacterium ADurb.Bin157]